MAATKHEKAGRDGRDGDDKGDEKGDEKGMKKRGDS